MRSFQKLAKAKTIFSFHFINSKIRWIKSFYNKFRNIKPISLKEAFHFKKLAKAQKLLSMFLLRNYARNLKKLFFYVKSS